MQNIKEIEREPFEDILRIQKKVTQFSDENEIFETVS